MRTDPSIGTFAPSRRSLAPKRKIPVSDRSFLAWDGEGVTHDWTPRVPITVNGTEQMVAPQSYVLFGASTGNGIHHELVGTSLSTMECLDLITKVGMKHPNHIHVGFSFGYDVNMILRDLSERDLTVLKKTNRCRFPLCCGADVPDPKCKNPHYELEYMPRKWFRVRNINTRINVKIYDVFTYFMCSFVKACTEYLGEDHPLLAAVTTGKGNRNVFTYDEMDSIIRPYMRMELAMMVDLMNTFRDHMLTAGIQPPEWYGPGTVARSLLTKSGARAAITRDLPDEITTASQYAYFGGRFEQYKTGQYVGDVYSYDIRSAYPHALRLLPNVARGQWLPMSSDTELHDFALYRIAYRFPKRGAAALLMPQPFPFRDHRHAIHYPINTVGWYWGVEVKAFAPMMEALDVLDGWVFVPESNERPFAFIADMYEQRREWKREGNQAQLALKLGMNSLYGKLAQRIGWNRKTRMPPSWHQLEYAGWVTAKCRSMMFNAMMQSPFNIIAAETDGLFTTVPLQLPLSHELGDWELERHDEIIYVQSGMYFVRNGDKWSKARTRGFGSDALNVDDAIAALDGLQKLTGHTTRFAGFNGYIGKPQLRAWVDAVPTASWGGGGKRAHANKLCAKCLGADMQMHECIISNPFGGNSHRHVLGWRDDVVNPYQEEADASAYYSEPSLWSPNSSDTPTTDRNTTLL